MIAIVPLLVCIAGALLYAFGDAKPAELGRLAFAVSLLVLVWGWAGKVIHLP